MIPYYILYFISYIELYILHLHDLGKERSPFRDNDTDTDTVSPTPDQTRRWLRHRAVLAPARTPSGDGEDLARIAIARCLVQLPGVVDQADLALRVLRRERDAGLAGREREELGAGGVAAAVGAAAAGEDVGRVDGAARVEVEAAVGQGAHDERGRAARHVVVLAGRDEVELLARRPRARLHRDRDEVLAEVAGRGVHEEAVARRGLEGRALDGSDCRVVELVGLRCGGGLEGPACAGD